MTPGGAEDFLDEHLMCDPAGAIFEETLEDLNDVDRQLLLFCSGSNLAAVRWLVVLGANKDACDSNGTTCLHAACRTGTLPIVKDLVRNGMPLDAVDISGWTPLHIAIFMGRRDVVLFLLQAGAPLHKKNLKAQTPVDMCSDMWMREAIRSFVQHHQKSPETPWHFEKENEALQDFSSSSRLRYEPFFVPRSPVMNDPAQKQGFQRLGQQIFNRRPGQGLAFLVASGCTRDYPVDMSAFLRKSKVDLAQIGNFLGEAFSLSQTLRLEFINSVKLHGTSVVSSLAKVFLLLHIPPDLQKIDRLVHGIARIWWRQHEKLGEVSGDATGGAGASANDAMKEVDSEKELEGFELKQYFVSPDALYQLMFSVVMLHWNFYTQSAQHGAGQRMSLSKWLDVNQGLEGNGGDIPVHVQRLIYRTVSKAFIPQLAIRRENAYQNADPERKAIGLSSHAKIENWVRLLRGGFPSPAGINGTITYTHMRDLSTVFSEATSTSRSTADPKAEATPRTPRAPGNPQDELSARRDALPAGWDAKSKDKAWLSMCFTLLFFSSSPTDEAPYAFLHLRRVVLQRVDPAQSTMTLVGCPEAGADINIPEGDPSKPGALPAACPVVLIFLLQDGRWQEFELPKLEVQFSDNRQLERWATHITSVCGDASMGPISGTLPSAPTMPQTPGQPNSSPNR